LFLGEMVGCEGGGERGEGKETKFWKEGDERKQFLHDEQTFEKMWEDVAEKTSTVGCWKIEGAFKKRGNMDGNDASHGCAFFTGEGIGCTCSPPYLSLFQAYCSYIFWEQSLLWRFKMEQ